jgi:hypothetical protein
MYVFTGPDAIPHCGHRCGTCADLDKQEADAAMYRARAQFWKGKSIATQVRERIDGVHSPVIGDPWNVTPDLSQTTMFAY